MSPVTQPPPPPPGCWPVKTIEDIVPEYRRTPIETLFLYHNLAAPFQEHAKPELLVGTCMDYRIQLRIAPNLAFVMRLGGANFRGLEFHMSLAIASGVRTICLIAHDQCAMAGVSNRGQTFVRGLADNGGWSEQEAQEHFESDAPNNDVGNSVEFAREEALRLSRRYPNTLVAPLFYSIENHVLFQVVSPD